MKRVIIKLKDAKGRPIFQIWEGDKSLSNKQIRESGACIATGFVKKQKAETWLKQHG